jgi:hypothetical protein
VSGRPVGVVDDALARIIRIAEAIADGDFDLAAFIAADLEQDFRDWLAAQRRVAAE